MSTRALWCGAAILALLGLAAPAHAQSPSGDLPTVAVSDFEGFLLGEAGNSAPVGKAVATMLITELSGREGIRVVERYRLQELLTEQKLSLSGRVDAQTLARIGEMVGAGYFVFGQVSGVGNAMRMDVRLVDAETSEVLEVQKLSSQPDRLLSMVVQLADLFMAELELEPPSARPEVAEIPVRATIDYSRAVDYEDRGEIERAVEHYRRALEAHPDHREARAALERLGAGRSER